MVEGVNVNAVEAHVKCHHAFARVEGRKGMATCPMYIDGLKVERVGGTLRMTTSPDKIAELRKRAKAHLNH